MNFRKLLAPEVSARVAYCDDMLTNPDRLEALRLTGLMDSPTEEAFDRLARLAGKLLNVPLTIVSVVGDKKQFFKAAYGLPAPYDKTREVSIEDSICRYTLHNEPIVTSDATKDELLKFHPTIGPWGIVAFIAIPMVTPEGHVLGAFCAVDTKVREWTEDELLVMNEMTASVMTEINLRLKVSQLETEKTLHERFVTTLSHDLRNPINIAKMATEMNAESDVTGEDRIMFQRMILDNLERADQMIQDLLNASLLKAGEELATSNLHGDLNEIIRGAVRNQTGVYGKRFELHCPKKPVLGFWNSKSLHRIIDNLCGNAVKYGDRETPIGISLKTLDNGIEISVRNQGNPIADSDLKNLFDLFQRSDSALSSSHKGWGIGLSVVRSLTEEMDGVVRVESDKEHGTRFTICLPLPHHEFAP